MTKITYGFYQSPLGEMVLGQTPKGLCWLGFMEPADEDRGYKGDGLSRMKSYFKDAEFDQDDAAIQPLAKQVVKAWEDGKEAEVQLDLQGTEFQCSVWASLLRISKGQVKTYGEVANDIGKPKASRAVGTAVGSNPVSLIVPCHRVVPSTGGVGNYGWGPELKERILKVEKY